MKEALSSRLKSRRTDCLCLPLSFELFHAWFFACQGMGVCMGLQKRVKVVNPENCSGCQICALACSFFNSKEKNFSLSKALIKISRINGEEKFQVDLLAQCTHCGICTQFCLYNVLKKVEVEG
jgi:Fe-S-cluster-containing dehydrogenase component